jgi:hypothetical protein
MLAFYDMMKKSIVMPAHLMDDLEHEAANGRNLFKDFSSVAQSTGTYTGKVRFLTLPQQGIYFGYLVPSRATRYLLWARYHRHSQHCAVSRVFEESLLINVYQRLSAISVWHPLCLPSTSPGKDRCGRGGPMICF